MSIFNDPKYCGFSEEAWTTILAALKLAEDSYQDSKTIRFSIYSQLATQDYIRVEHLTEKLPKLHADKTNVTQTLQNTDCTTSQLSVS